MDKIIYLDLLHDRNETPHLELADRLPELLPVVLTRSSRRLQREQLADWSADIGHNPDYNEAK